MSNMCMHKVKRLLFPTTPSTHQYCEENLDDLVEKFLSDNKNALVSIRADEQTKGKGRRKADSEGSNSWLSPPGGLYLTCILPASEQNHLLEQRVLIATVLSLIEHVAKKVSEKTLIPIHISWPNDLIGPKGKIAGMMVSSQYSTQVERYFALISIGFNIASSPRPGLFDSLASHDPSIEQNSSYYIEFIQNLIEQYLASVRLDQACSKKTGPGTFYPAAFCPRMFWENQGLIFNRPYSWYQKSQKSISGDFVYQEGILQDMDSIGRLKCLLSCGKTVTLSSEQVHRLRPR